MPARVVLLLPTLLCQVGSYTSPLAASECFTGKTKSRIMSDIARVARAVLSFMTLMSTLKAMGMRNRDIRALKKCCGSKLGLLVETPEHASFTSQLAARLADGQYVFGRTAGVWKRACRPRKW